MKEMIKNVGELAITKMRLINRIRKTGEYAENIRKFPMYSEFYGIILTLKSMGIDYDIEFNPQDLDEMTAIVILGQRFEI